MNSKKKKIMFVILGIIAIVAIVMTLLLISKQNSFEYEGWINCQPILTKEAAELCERAEAAGYPYIAY